jgi:RND superfamily putative drug exporter
MRRPLASVLVTGAALVLLAIPALDMNRGSSDGESLPAGEARTALKILETQFSAGMIEPLEIAIGADRTPEIEASISALQAAMANDAAFGPVLSSGWNDAGTLAVIDVPLTMPGNDPAAGRAIERLRGTLIPTAFAGTDALVLVGNDPAVDYDLAKLVDTWTPRIFVIVLGFSFLLLLLAFRSIVIPIKAIVLNLLSVGAAYGLMVLVFQRGYGADLLGFTKVASIETWVPIFLFCILFGLSMDYHVFLLSRIREHYDQTHNNEESVVSGLRSTARLITGAAIIMVVVFAAFATASLTMFQQLGFGLAVAILLDSTVIRIVLVPASMKLLGDRNWYLPHWLNWLPQMHIEGTPGQTTIAGVGDD